MNCPRCQGPYVLRTGDHDELRHFREPFACFACGLAFDTAATLGVQIQLFADPAKRGGDGHRYAA